ncbi:MAG: hypothetical protein Q8O32_02460 [bacterium]|nr:hypothetical protein [bacterium]
MAKQKVKSLHIPVTEDDLKRLDDIREQVSASSRSEVVRKAIKLYNLVYAYYQDGYTIEFRKDGKSVSIIIM